MDQIDLLHRQARHTLNSSYGVAPKQPDPAALAEFHRSVALQCRIIGLQLRDHHGPVAAKAFEMGDWYDATAKQWESLSMQKDTPPTPPEPDKPWNDDTAIPDVTQPGWMDPKPGEDTNPPSGDPTKH